MDKAHWVHHKRRPYLWFALLLGVFMSGCAAIPDGEKKLAQLEVPVVESVRVNPTPEGTQVAVVSSTSAPYTAFKLNDPPRIILDIRGTLSDDLAETTRVNDGHVKEIRFEKGKTQAMTSRMIVSLVRPMDYEVEADDNVIQMSLIPRGAVEETSPPVAGDTSPTTEEGVETAEQEVVPSDPRIFFEPRASELNQVLGIDFTMLEQGKSRLIVTTDKRARYELDRKGPKVLNLTLPKTTIPPLLMRQIDATHFAGAVERVEATVLAEAKGVSIDLHLKEMVPFHLKQTDRDISIDFGHTSVRPPEKKLIPLQLAEARTPRQTHTEPLMAEPQVVKGRAAIPGLRPVAYTGSRMTMDFVNADVTNILRLIGEVSNLNIVWGPEVRGNVSMRLKDVPWDQALDLVLANNNLAQRQVGNVIWITTKGQMANIEAEERKKLDELEKRREQQQRDRVKVEPLETQYITVNFKGANDLQRVIDDTIKSDRGRTTVDQPTKTIIITDTRAKIEEARALVERLDRPTPQVMIEARIVEASQNFARNLGIQWGTGNNWQWREPGSTSWNGTPAWAPNNVPADYSPGASLTNPSFSADTPSSPADYAANLGFTLAKLSSNGLFGWSLDAKIALSEIENESKLLAAPKVMTRDTVTATIQQGTKIVIPSGTDANGNKTFEQQDASLKLEVTPQITPNNMVIMQVHIQQDEPDFDNAIGENIPIKTKSASTMMMVASGETLVIGGIYKSNVTEGESRVPGLGSIPGLGWLFKAQRKRIERVELLLFITPTVIPAA